MITKSAQKAYRQNLKRRAHNAKQKMAFKKLIKDYKKLVAAKDLKKAEEKLPSVYKALDKAAKTNLIKKNNASRTKSRLTKLINKK
ncbi:MAG: 30S ribosomal protein S20 [Patescibacteria group bacterium]|nr:30S ribosomal protein S20 [Patescibacteria group bacterium]